VTREAVAAILRGLIPAADVREIDDYAVEVSFAGIGVALGVFVVGGRVCVSDLHAISTRFGLGTEWPVDALAILKHHDCRLLGGEIVARAETGAVYGTTYRVAACVHELRRFLEWRGELIAACPTVLA